MFATPNFVHFENYFGAFHGNTLTFNMPTEIEQADIAFSGVRTYGFCHGIVKEFEGLIRTLEAFLGGLSDHPSLPIIGSHVPAYMEKANIQFLSEVVEYTMEPRTNTDLITIDPDLIQSGDYLAVMRLDGLDQIIMYGTGSHSGHSVVAMRFDGELYIVESQDAWYWPTHGLQRTKWDVWLT